MDVNKVELILRRLRQTRLDKNLSIEKIARAINVGPDWIQALEEGNVTPTLEMIIAIADAASIDLSKILLDLDDGTISTTLSRSIIAQQHGNDLVLKFRYGDYLAKYLQQNATLQDFNELLADFRANSYDPKVKKSDFVIKSFFKAMELWSHANPSDIWGFFLSRLYQDPYNHPVTEQFRDYAQSWKRTSGWVLERIFVDHYSETLYKNGIRIEIYPLEIVKKYLRKMKLNYHDVEEKADVLVINEKSDDCFGVIHVKASLAERRQADQSFSQALLGKNYFSPFLTMDCKSMPSENPYNKGEFGPVKTQEEDLRINKRLDFEEEGYFSACYSYNSNTIPTPADQRATARIYTMDFSNPVDQFSKDVIAARDRLFSG